MEWGENKQKCSGRRPEMAGRAELAGMDGLKAAFGAKKRVVVPRKIALDKTCSTLNELALRAVVSQVRTFFPTTNEPSFRASCPSLACIPQIDGACPTDATLEEAEEISSALLDWPRQGLR